MEKGPKRPRRGRRQESRVCYARQNHTLTAAVMAGAKDLAPHTENRYGSPCYTAMGALPRALLLGCHQGCYLRLLPTSRWAAEVVHRPGKSGSFLKETAQGPTSALFIPNYSWKAVGSQLRKGLDLDARAAL